jgi:hypothetical protein
MVPPWAAFFSKEQHAAFLHAVDAYFRSRGRTAQVNGDEGYVAVYDDPDLAEGVPLGLSNLAQTCNQEPPDRWPARIDAHFEAMRLANRESAEVEQSLGDFARARDLLAVRIGRVEDLAPMRATLLAREDLPGTLSYLVLDLPHVVATASSDHATQWGEQTPELFEIGLANVRRMPLPEVSRLTDEDGSELVALTGDHFFVATHALFLHEHPECLGAHGTLVVVPHRHAVLCSPVHDLRVVTAVQRMAILADRMERQGPGSISAKLYYRYPDGRFMDLPYVLADRKFHFIPPDPFVDLLNQLAEPPQGLG